MLFSWLIFVMAFKSLSTLFTRFILSVTLGKGVYSGTSLVLAAQDINNGSNTLQNTIDKETPPLYLMTGTFTYGHSTNFEAYLKELGVPYLLRSLALLASPVVTISKSCPNKSFKEEECTWKIRTDTIFRSHEAEFTLNTESSTTRMDGQAVRFIFRKDGDHKLIEHQTNVGGSEISTDIIRDFSDPSRMVVNLRVNNVNASSVFYRSNYSESAI
uniref:Fatty acid-binding protein n=1 Tax=Caligus clemensi TaxID=344056 RepID=C1C351_CALCM|nr:Fatty acid-binding protein [Caligus clemensi]